MSSAAQPIDPTDATAGSPSAAAGDAEARLEEWVDAHPDFPKPGILFRCMMPLLRDPVGWQLMLDRMGEVCERLQPELIVGIESRGFLIGSALATARRLPFVPVRKPGKLPGDVIGIDYTLEYGSDRLEIQSRGLVHNPRVLIVDDLLATGGTAAAAGELVRRSGGELCGFGFVIELAELGGRDRLPAEVPVESLIVYD